MTDMPKRRPFRFSLRSLLVLVVVLAIPLAWIGKERHQSKHEQEVADQLRKLGFEVELKGPYDSGFRGGPSQPGWRNIARQVIGERIVFFRASSHDFEDLTPLANLSRLQQLGLDDTNVSDLTPLARLRSLREIALSGTKVTDLSPLAGLTELTFLKACYIPVSDVSPLKGLKKMEWVSIRGTKVTDISPLAGLLALKEVDVSGMSMSDEQVTKLQEALPNCSIYPKPSWRPRWR